jgi:tetratricopeptide (TPR) repeat protein
MSLVRGRGPALAAAALGVVAVAAFATGLSDPDVFHHLAYGRVLARLGGFPATEPLLFPFQGVGVAPEAHWLGSLTTYLAWRLGGDAGVVLLPALTGAATLAVVLAAAGEDARASWRGLAAAVVPLVLAAATLRPRMVGRPEVTGLLLFAVTLLALRRAGAGRLRLLAAWPLLAVVWGNVHRSVLVGLALVALHVLVLGGRALAARLRPGRVAGPPRRELWVSGAAAVLGAAALLATPSGLAPIREAFTLVSSLLGHAPAAAAASAAAPAGPDALTFLRHYVDELAPLPLSAAASPFGAVVALAVVALAAGGWRAGIEEPLQLALLVALALPAARFAMFTTVVAAAIAARHLSAAAARQAGRRAALAGAGAALAATLAAGWGVLERGPAEPGLSLRAELFPVAAADHLARLGGTGRVYDTFHLGGFLEWRLDRPVYQDGRGWIGDGEREAALFGPARPELFDELDRRWRFDALVVAYPTTQGDAQAAAHLAARAGEDWAADRRRWALVAFDDGGLLYLRRDGAWGAQAARDEYRTAMPANAMTSEQFADPAAAAALVADLRRAVAERPACRVCRVQLGIALLQTGHAAEAEPVLLPARRGEDPVTTRFALVALSEAARARGDRAAALARLEEAIASGVDPAPLRATAAELALDGAELARAAALLAPNLAGEASPDDLALGARIARSQGDTGRAHGLEERLPAARAREAATPLAAEGAAAALAGRWPEAVAAYGAALAAYEPDPALQAGLGRALLGAGRPAEAVARFRRALELAPRSPDALYGLGEALAVAGDRSGAREALTRFLAEEPRGERALAAETRLARLGGVGR